MSVPYRRCLETGPWGVYIAWADSRGKDQRALLLFGSWKTFSGTSIYQEAAHKYRAWALSVSWGRCGKNSDRTALAPRDRISGSPQEGELRTQTRPSDQDLPHHPALVRNASCRELDIQEKLEGQARLTS